MEQQANAAAHSSTHVLLRFAVRLAILIVFAFVAHIGFAQAFPRFLLLAGVFCALWALLQGETLLGPVLTHWDEAAALVILSKLTAAIA